MNTQTNLPSIIRSVIETEAKHLLNYISIPRPELLNAVDLIVQSSGPLIVCGIGKSGHIARKIASTFCSLGKPSLFVHPCEASHGDLGVIQPNSVIMILSNSGETNELSDLLHYCRSNKIPIISITANKKSTLSQFSRVVIDYGNLDEACLNGLAPTTSTTMALAIGDALAVATSSELKIAPEDFFRYHPGGKLGSRFLKASDLMRTGADLPIVSRFDPVTDIVIVMTEKSLGTAIVLDHGSLYGIITDGDMRRNIKTLWSCNAQDIATTDPVRIPSSTLIDDAISLMNDRNITSCIVDDSAGNFIGLLHIHDCLTNWK